MLLVGVARGGVTTPTRTKHGDGVDGIANNNSKIHHINKISGEINSGVELTREWVELVVLVVRRGREDGHRRLKVSSISNNNSINSMVTIATIRQADTTTSHSNSHLTNMALITRGSLMGIRHHSYKSHQWTECREAQEHLLYRNYSPLLELMNQVMRGARLPGGSTHTPHLLLLRSLVVRERESLTANE